MKYEADSRTSTMCMNPRMVCVADAAAPVFAPAFMIILSNSGSYRCMVTLTHGVTILKPAI